APGRLSVPEGPKRSDLELEHSTRPAGLKADKQVDHDLLAALEELLRPVGHLLEGLDQILEEPVCRLAATVVAGTWDAAPRLQFELGMNVIKGSAHVGFADRLISGPKRLHVLPRHCLLRESHGFEGLGPTIEGAPPDALPAPPPAHIPDRLVQRHVATRTVA